MYNTTAMTANTSGYNSMLAFVRGTSIETNYLPGVAILLSLWLVLFFALRMKGNPAKVSIAAASWAVTMVALLMYPLGIINALTYIISLVITPVSILLLFLMDND